MAQIKKAVHILMGNGFLKAGMLSDARNAYKMAGENILSEKLIEYGDSRILAFRSCDSTKQQQIVVLLSDARIAYTEAGALAKVAECGRALLSSLSSITDNDFKAELLKQARLAYESAADTTGLIECGDACMKYGFLLEAFAAYTAVKNRAKIIECGDACIAKGWVSDAEAIYESAIQFP